MLACVGKFLASLSVRPAFPLRSPSGVMHALDCVHVVLIVSRPRPTLAMYMHHLAPFDVSRAITTGPSRLMYQERLPPHLVFLRVVVCLAYM